MKDEQHNNNWRRIVWLGFFVVLLVFIGVLLKNKLDYFLYVHVEEHVTIQAEIIADAIDSNFQMKLNELESIADNLQEYEDDMQEIMKFLLNDEQSDYTMGVLALGGKAVYGNELNFQEFSGIQESFRGNPAVCYSEGKGLLFTVPVYSGSNIKYVLYRLYEESVLVEEFGLNHNKDEGELLVVDNEGIVIPSANWNAELEEALFGGAREQAFSKIREKMNIATAAAVYDDASEELVYLFVAEIGDTDMYLIGFFPKSAFSEGIAEIEDLVLWVFGLLALIFAIGLAYMFSAEEKVRESNKLRHEKEMAEHANQIKSDFLARMSHEIRTPINTVVGMNEMILRECGNEEIRSYANNIAVASRNLLALINDILDFSKIESGKMKIMETKYELGNVINNAVHMIQFRAEQKNLLFNLDVDEMLPFMLYGDGDRIQQVLLNLLSNAVKYTQSGGFTMTVRGEKTDEETILLEFSVEDTGIGIREEDMERLFQDFERLDMDRNRNIEGTGLGLAISYRLAKQMEGELTVSSEYGKGTVFVFRLPQRIVGRENIGNFKARYGYEQSSKKEDGQKFIAPDAHVLAVDDNEMNLLVVKNLLKKSQIQVTCCMGGTECLEAVRQRHFDMVFLDHMMPGMDGIETVKALRKMQEQEGYTMPVIALTANAIEGVREMYLKAGFDDYLSKPIEVNELEDMLLKYIPKDKCRSNEQYLNPTLGRQYCDNDEELYREVLQMFCNMKEDKKKKLQAYLNTEDWKNYTIQIHALKSTSLSIGAKMLSEQAAELEKAGKQGQIEYINKMHEDTMKLYDQIICEAEAYLQKGIEDETYSCS